MNNNNSNCYTLRVCSSFAAKRVKQETQIFRMYSQTFVHILHRLDISVFLRTVGEGKSLGISTRTSGLSRSLIIERQDLSIPRSTHTHTHTHTQRRMSRVSITNEIDSSSSGSHRHCQASPRIPIGTKCLADSYSSRNPVSTFPPCYSSISDSYN